MPGATSLELIEKLVAFDTTSRNTNLDLISFVQGYLAHLGITSSRIHNETGSKANLYATIGPENVSGVLLSGHTDVVPVDGQDWHTDPFQIVKKENKIFGRGTSDMKSFIGITLATIPKFIGKTLKVPLHLAFSYDEEVGCLGVRSLIDFVNDLPVKPIMAIIGEPTSMEVVTGHKGKRSYVGQVEGYEAHSSLAPLGVNAVEYAAEFIAFLKTMARNIEKDGPFDPLYDVQHSTLHVGTIRGGTALNIVPKVCTFDFEFRYIGDEDPDQIETQFMTYASEKIEPKMKAVSESSKFNIKRVNDVPGLDISPDHEAVSFVKRLAKRNDYKKVAFGTEAGLYQHRGEIPAVICGPGSIEQAHKPNEFITLDQIHLAENFFLRLMDNICEN